MHFEDRRQAENTAWQGFVRQLGDHLSGQWPAMLQRLGERYAAFIDVAVDQALRRGLQDCAAVARWVNLCFAWGPAFDEKPEFAWAAEVLSAPGAHEWLVVHQLVHRSVVELERQNGARLAPQALRAADLRLIEVFGAWGRHGALLSPPAEPMAKALVACDVEAFEVRQAEQPVLSDYRLDGDVWTREPAPALAPIRVDVQHPLPAALHLLSPMEGDAARLRIRVRPHASCDGAHHPAFRCTGPLGASTWSGHDSREVELALLPRLQPPPPLGMASWVAEETAPEYYKLEWQVCGLRDAGRAVGPLSSLLAVWPACRWWTEFQRAEPAMQALLGTSGSDGQANVKAWQAANTRARIERDGRSQDARALVTVFEAGLDAASKTALARLAQAWARVGDVRGATLDALWGQLQGRAALAWAWHTAALEAAPSMRVLGQLDLQAAHVDLTFGGTLEWAGARAKLTLRCAGRAPLQGELRHEAAAPTLAERIACGACVAWRFPFEASLAPLADPGGALLQLDGEVRGALVGMAGLRPNTHGGSGFEWFAEARLEAVSLPLAVLDPTLGERRGALELLPEQPLLAWSLGDG